MMTLHDAIEKLLRQTKHSMSAYEIAEELNKNKWYSKGDNSHIKPNQISARVDNYQAIFIVNRSVSPYQISLVNNKPHPITHSASKVGNVKKEEAPNQNLVDHKKSFEPISNSETEILILGTIPGDKSLELNEYYGHPRNRFWKIIAVISNNPLPLTYPDKKALLFKTKIGIWDVAHHAIRKGSLDKDIQEEKPNDLHGFISHHKNLKIIGFNGAKSEVLFNKYFTRNMAIRYISLPSTSPANAGINFDNICKIWRQVLT